MNNVKQSENSLVRSFGTWIKIFLLLSLLLLGDIQNSKATSGACSYHAGVNCEAGMQSNGVVYCNDGWTDSSVLYEYMEMCKPDPFAFEKISWLSYDYEWVRGPEGYQCKYFTSIESYNSASKVAVQNISGFISSLEASGVDFNDERLKFLYVSKGRFNNTFMGGLNSCAQIDGLIDRWKSPSGVCESGFWQAKGGCFPASMWCQSVYGQHSISTNDIIVNSCGCVSGYTWNKNWRTYLENIGSGVPELYLAHNFACLPTQIENETSTPVPVNTNTNVTTKNVPLTPQESHLQFCLRTYGDHSVPVGERSACACESGYVWTTDLKSCIASNINSTSTVPKDTNGSTSSTQFICEIKYGPHAKWDGATCGCASWYELSADGKTCVPAIGNKSETSNAPISTAKYGLWSWFKSFFRF